MKNRKSFWQPMKAEQMKYAIIAFWLCASFAILPRYLPLGRPCALCLIQNILYTILAALCFFAKWAPLMRKASEICAYIIALTATYHMTIVLNIITGPKVCSLNATFLEKTLSACNQSSPWMVATSFSLSLILLWLLKKAK